MFVELLFAQEQYLIFAMNIVKFRQKYINWRINSKSIVDCKSFDTWLFLFNGSSMRKTSDDIKYEDLAIFIQMIEMNVIGRHSALKICWQLSRYCD